MVDVQLMRYARPPTHATVFLFSRSWTCNDSVGHSHTRNRDSPTHLCRHIAIIAALVLLGHASAQTRPLVQFHEQARLGRREHTLRQRLHRSLRLPAEVLQLLAPPVYLLACCLTALQLMGARCDLHAAAVQGAGHSHRGSDNIAATTCDNQQAKEERAQLCCETWGAR
jgi:hypothetical protein